MFHVQILGSNSALPIVGHYPSAQVVQHKQNIFLLDCGEGTQMRMNELHIKKFSIEHIFITHLHGDHYFGLPGLLTTMSLLRRTKTLYIYSPVGLRKIIEGHFENSKHAMSYEIVWNEHQAEHPIRVFESEDLIVETVPLKHFCPCTGYVFREKEKQKAFIPEMGEKYEIPHQAIRGIKKGDDFTLANGTVVLNSELTYPAKPSYSYAYITDTAYTESIIDQIRNVSLLYHEATFLDEDAEVAAERGHATATEAAKIALKADARKLLIGHLSTKIKDKSLSVKEARKVFPETYFATEGEIFDIK